LITAEELSKHVKACGQNKRESQKFIYTAFYGFSMAICDRYTNKQDDALEILNDGFLKVFKEIHRFQPAYADTISSFKGWLKKIMIYTAIDHFRKFKKHSIVTQLDAVQYQIPSISENALEKLSYEEIIKAIQDLSPAYCTVFNLFVIDGFTHEEIAAQIGIAVGTSKSNLSKARRQLQKILIQQNIIQLEKNAI